MQSLLSRFRSRSLSNASPPVDAPATTTAPIAAIHTPTNNAFVVPDPQALSRKIHPDLDSLLESYSSVAPTVSPGLKPPTKRRSLDGSGVRANPGLRPGDPVLEVDEFEDTPNRRSTSLSRSRERSSSHSPTGPSRREEAPTGHSREWSTFGRNSEPRPRDAGQSGLAFKDFLPVRRSSSKRAKRASKNDSVRSTSSQPRSFMISSRPSTAPTQQSQSRSHSPATPSAPPSPQTKYSSSSPENTISSRRHSRLPVTAPFTPSNSSNSRSTQAHSAIDSSRNGVAVDESPRTFGHLTPPDSRINSSGFTVSVGWNDTSGPPPLPPLDHPAFASSLHSRVVSHSHGRTLAVPGTLDTHPGHHQAKTRKRSATISNDRYPEAPAPYGRAPRPRRNTFATVPFSFGKSFRSRSDSSPGPARARNRTSAESMRRSPSSRRQSVGRRRSADWSAQQAVSGVNALGEVSWPAEVSREMLRLSFGTERIPPAPVTSRSATAAGRQTPDERANNSFPRGSPSTAQYPPTPPQSTSPLFPLSNSNSSVFFTNSKHLENSYYLEEDASNLSDPDDTNNDPYTTARLGGEHWDTEMPASSSAQASIADREENASADPAPPPSTDGAEPSPPPTLTPPILSLTAATPSTSPVRSPLRSASDPTVSPPALIVPSQTPPARSTSGRATGKRKSERDERAIGPEHYRKDSQRATFAIPPDGRVHRSSGTSTSSRAPSAYGHKRPPLSNVPPLPSSQARSSSALKNVKAGSWSSSDSRRISGQNLSPAPSRRASTRSATAEGKHTRVSESRPSMSQASIPISALVSPHAPSISPSGTYHMRDPHKPKKVHNTGWALRFRNEKNDEHASPVQAWCFFVGFVFFFVWWVASFWKVPTTRTVGGTDVEKAVIVDDPQVEHDAKSWRFRCRVMSAISLVTYIPFIVLLAVFIRR